MSGLVKCCYAVIWVSQYVSHMSESVCEKHHPPLTSILGGNLCWNYQRIWTDCWVICKNILFWSIHENWFNFFLNNSLFFLFVLKSVSLRFPSICQVALLKAELAWFCTFIQDAHNLTHTELVMSGWVELSVPDPISPTMKLRVLLGGLNGIRERALYPGFNYTHFKTSVDLMRAPLIAHEGSGTCVFLRRLQGPWGHRYYCL